MADSRLEGKLRRGIMWEIRRVEERGVGRGRGRGGEGERRGGKVA